MDSTSLFCFWGQPVTWIVPKWHISLIAVKPVLAQTELAISKVDAGVKSRNNFTNMRTCLSFLQAVSMGPVRSSLHISAVSQANVKHHQLSIPLRVAKPCERVISVPTSVYLPLQNEKAPLVFIMGGFFVPKSTYSEFATSTAARGYAVVVADVIRPGIIPEQFSGPLKAAADAANAIAPNTCDPDGVMPVPNILPAFLEWVDSMAQGTGQSEGEEVAVNIDTKRVVVVAHSSGGPSVEFLTSTLDHNPDYMLCDSPVSIETKNDVAGRLKGLIYYEAVDEAKEGTPIVNFSPQTPPTMLIFANSENASEAAYKANPDTVFACAQIPKGNHYSILNWIEHRSPSQICPCAISASSSDTRVSFTTTRAEHSTALEAVTTISALCLEAMFEKTGMQEFPNSNQFEESLHLISGIGNIQVRKIKASSAREPTLTL